MAPPKDRSVRIVVQYVRERNSRKSVYRLIAYGDDRTYRPSEFDSLHSLLQALRTALPNFEERRLSRPSGNDGTCVIFGEVLELNDMQFSLLGLTGGEKSVPG